MYEIIKLSESTYYPQSNDEVEIMDKYQSSERIHNFHQKQRKQEHVCINEDAQQELNIVPNFLISFCYTNGHYLCQKLRHLYFIFPFDRQFTALKIQYNGNRSYTFAVSFLLGVACRFAFNNKPT